MEYYSLDLQITKGPEGSPNLYRAAILENEDTKVTRSFELRRDLKLIQMLKDIEEKALITYPQPNEITQLELGKILYSAVFSGEVGDYFNKRFKEAQEKNCGLRLFIQFSKDIPEIGALPWEYLHNGKDFLITSRSILLSRLAPEVKKTESQSSDSILRMLVVISGPDDPRISPLNTEREQEIILEAVDKLSKEQKIKVDFTEDATFENIQGYLKEHNYHIVHFTGHGINFEGKSYLVFETEDRKAKLIDNKTLADLFSETGVTLVVLSSCESAKGSNKEAFGDLASMLSKSRIPAVIAMQYSIIDDVAINFAYTFYETIAKGKPIDLAMNEARTSMRNSKKSNGFDFGTPVLYLSDPKCIRVGDIKPDPEAFGFKPMELPDLQVMRSGFVARNRELKILEKGLLSNEKRAAIIHGLGGMGKTVLATRFALKKNEYFDGIFGMRCTSNSRPEEILTKVNNFLMMRGISELNHILNQQVPLEVKTAILVNIFNQFRFLIILDNFEDCLDKDQKDIANPELKKFIQCLLKNTIYSTKFIITTRYDFDPLDGRFTESTEHISLPELHFPQTNWLMNNYTEFVDLSVSKKRQIYDLIGGHPWTVRQFANFTSAQGLDSLMLDLKPLKKELIEFTLLDKSFSKLDTGAKKLLFFASVYEEAVPVEALSWIVGDDIEESPSIIEPLQKLIQWGLISKEQEYDQTVYTEHAIVRDFSLDRLEEEGLDKRKLLIRAARYYENLVPKTENLWDNLKARDYYFWAEDWESANKIVESTSKYLIRWGHIRLAMNLLNESISTTSGATKIYAEYTLATIYDRLGDTNTALKIYNNVKNKFKGLGDNRGVSIVLHALGNVHYLQGNYEEAVKKYNQSLKISEELGDKSGIALTLLQLGMIHQDQGNYEEAMKMYNKSLKIKVELQDKSGIAAALRQLGMIHQDQGNYEEAMKKYDQCLRIAEELGDKKEIAYTSHALGMIHQDQGNYEEAVKKYNLSLEISEELGDRRAIAQVLGQLGNVHQDQCNYKEAVKKYNQAMKIAEELGDRSGIAQKLHQLGNVHYHQGNYGEAVKNYDQCLRIAEELGDKRAIAQVLGQLANVHYDQGNYEEAVKKYDHTLRIAEELGDKRVIAITLHQLGITHHDQGNYEEAVKKYNLSLEISEELGDKRGTAQTLHQLGMIHQAQGNYKEAVKKYDQCLRIAEELGDKREIANTYGQLGMIYEAKKEYVFALQSYLKAYFIFKKLNSPYCQLTSELILKLKDKMGEEEFNSVLKK